MSAAFTRNSLGRWPIAAALFAAFCSQGPSTSPVSPSQSSPSAGVDSGRVGATAVGDVTVGPGALEMVRLRMDRQLPAGVSVLRQYVSPGQTYQMNPGETVELWAEWNFTAVPGSPRFKVEWGDGTDDITGCGSCLLTHRYPNAGLYTVKAILDDRVSTMVTRTFQVDSRTPVLSSVSAQCSQPYTTFTDPGRNIATFNSNLFCDNGSGNGWVGAGWYRFSGGAGTRLSETPPPILACETHAPGWLNGTHPSIEAGVVAATACFNWSGNQCWAQTGIQVVNCDGFYLYYLPDTPGCTLRYCGTN